MDMISPGIYTQIIDLSTYVNSVSGTIGFVPILSDKGPDNVLTKVEGLNDYITKFGEPDIRKFGKYYGQGPYVATQHLSVSNDLYVIRCLPDDAAYSHIFIAFTKKVRFPMEYSSSGEDGDRVKEESISLCAFNVSGTTYPVIGTFGSEDKKAYYTIPSGEGDEQIKLDAIAAGVAYTDGRADAGQPQKTTDPEKAIYTSDRQFAMESKIPPMANTKKLNSLFTDYQLAYQMFDQNGYEPYRQGIKCSDCVLMWVRAKGRGDHYNDLAVAITSDANPQKFGTYTFQVYQLQDGSYSMVEAFNVSFDRTAVDSDGESIFIQDVVNSYSDYVHIGLNDKALDIIDEQMDDFYKNDPTIADMTSKYTVGLGFPEKVPLCVIDEDKNKATIENYELPEGYELGYKAKMIWDAYRDIAVAKKNTFDATLHYNEAYENRKNPDWKDEWDKNAEEALAAASEEMTEARQQTERAENILSWSQALNMLDLSDSDDYILGNQPFPMNGGSLGSLVDVDDVTGKYTVNNQVATKILCDAYTGLLMNPVYMEKEDPETGTIVYKEQYTSNIFDTDWIYFTIVYDAGYKTDVKKAAFELVDTYRRDCVLISDCGDNSECNDCLEYVGYRKGGGEALSWNSYLAARYEPYSKIYDSYTGTDIWVSPVYHMAKLLPQTDALYNVWYAAAGFKRGMASDVKELRYSANKSERDSLYQAQVNPIVHFPEGMTVFGQLTTQKSLSALSDLNCVRTMLYIKRAIEQYCRNYIFDHNNSTTWTSISNGIKSLLNSVQSGGGISSYEIDVGATDYEYKTKVCHVNVTIAPTRVLEKIQFNLYIE